VVGEVDVVTQMIPLLSRCGRPLAAQSCENARRQGEDEIHHRLWRGQRRFAMAAR
jgi:hypothetical protein